MEIRTDILKNEEKVVFRLRDIYSRFGYSYFKMGKFEEYDLYSKNKEFLVSDSVITFTDTNGKLMAMKPDVTLSIVKNTRVVPGSVQRLYYNENVYRISPQTHSYREIMQTGLECLGDVDFYQRCEVLRLAVESLREISEECVLNISHLGVISAALEGLELGESLPRLLKCIEDKNPGGAEALCRENRVPEEKTRLLTALARAYGREEALEELKALGGDRAALEELEAVLKVCDDLENVRIKVDFSVLNDMNYYNGLVFRGYVQGVPTRVLSGGQYDRLMKKMGKDGRAIGFAVYLDLLERLDAPGEYDTDVLLLYSEQDSPAAVLQRVRELTLEGKTVSAQRVIPEKLTCRVVEKMQREEG